MRAIRNNNSVSPRRKLGDHDRDSNRGSTHAVDNQSPTRNNFHARHKS